MIALLLTPVVALYVCPYLFHNPDVSFTGFIQYDMASYMANAREHFDNGYFRFSYSNPFSYSYESKAIYFQPQTLLLALIWKLTGLDPGVVFNIFGIFSAFTCAWIILIFFESQFGLQDKTNWIGLAIFFWGGGLIAIGGIAHNFLNIRPLFDEVFRFDPGRGWWFLNLGRNIVYPTEAFYHALFFGIAFLVLKKKYCQSYLLSLLLIFSHPFTGVEITLILSAWALLEKLMIRDTDVPWQFLGVQILLLGLIYGYYFFYLGMDPEHSSVHNQFSLRWSFGRYQIIFAYSLTGLLVLGRILESGSTIEIVSRKSDRFFFTWFLVAFLLSKHEWFMNPIQPLHFTRGYIWSPLFLLGYPFLRSVFLRLGSQKRILIKYGLVSSIIFLLLSDNIIWFFQQISTTHVGQHAIYRTAEMDELFDHLNSHSYSRNLVVTMDYDLAYLVNVYTPLRTIASHWCNTPYVKERKNSIKDFFERGKISSLWPDLDLLIVCHKPCGNTSILEGCLTDKVFENTHYLVCQSKSFQKMK